MKKLKIKQLILLIISLILFIMLIISIVNIITWILDSNNTNNQIEEIQNIVNIEESNDNENTEIIEQENIDENNPYWDYIKMNLINVDFNELKTINNQTVGWIQVSGTNINYPFVQATDNNYYLLTLLTKVITKLDGYF